MKEKNKLPAKEKRTGLLFGFGRMGITHIALLNKYFEGEIQWDVYEPSWKIRWLIRFFKSMTGLTVVSEQAIASKKYDFAVICSPPKFHQANYDLVKKNTGKIFLEKPGLVKAERLDNLYVGYVLRHAPCVAEMQRLLKDEELMSLSIDIRSNTVTGDTTGWRGSLDGGGVVNEFGSHAINLAKYLAGEEYSISKFETSRVVSSVCPDKCSINAKTESQTEIDISLNWSDSTVRKPSYKIIASLQNGTEIHTDLYQIWTVNADGSKGNVSGVAYWDSNCKYYLRGLEFSEQARYFSDQGDFTIDLSDSDFTDRILRENT